MRARVPRETAAPQQAKGAAQGRPLQGLPVVPAAVPGRAPAGLEGPAGWFPPWGERAAAPVRAPVPAGRAAMPAPAVPMLEARVDTRWGAAQARKAPPGCPAQGQG